MFNGITSTLTPEERRIVEAYKRLLSRWRAERSLRWLSENSTNIAEAEREYRLRIARNRWWNRYDYNLR